MRVERLELTGIGPFRETQVIDFATLSQSGLFLIDGPTGAGKTTIIDAIVFALFSGLSGENSSKERIRSDHSLPSEKSEVTLDFSVHGRRHRITRSPGYQVAKPGGDGFTTRAAKQSLVEFNSDGTAKTTLTSAADIGSHVSALLNMQAAQFRQLVVLAQGEFAALLRMKPKDRLEALRGLLGTQFFRDLQTYIYEQGQQSKQVLAESRKKLADIATRAATFRSDDNGEQLDPLLTTLMSSESSAEESLAAFESLISVFESMENVANENHNTAQTHLEPVEQEFNAITLLHSSLSALREAKAELLEAEFRLDPLDTTVQHSEIATLVQSLTLEAGALEPLIEWDNSAKERQEHHASLKKDLEEAQSEFTLFTQELELLPVRIKELRDHVSREHELRVKCEAATETKKSLAKRLEKFDELGQAQSELQTTAEEYRVARGEFDASEIAVERARTHISDLSARRLEQQVAVLAQALIPGEPCAVCGSIDHPAPATSNDTHSAGEFVTDADVAKAEKDLKSRLKDRDSLKEKLDAAQEVHNAAELHVAEIKGAVGDKSATDLAGELSTISAELGELEDQLVIVHEQAQELATCDEELTLGETRLTELRELKNKAETELALHEKQDQAMRESLRRAIGENATAIQVRDSMLNRAAALTNLADKVRVVRDLEKNVPTTNLSFEEIQTQFASLKDQVEALEKQVKMSAGELAVATSQLSKVRELASEYARQIKADAKLHTAHETRIRLAGLVTAQSSQNIKKLPLESYALQLRFQHVLEAASHHLDKMSAGRLSFVLDEDSQSNALAGLGIDVLDSWTGESRSPQTLSGGETFYASLALALGLADVVQAETGGVSLETLFVDEGFGSLDQESLQLVLDQLDQLKSGGRVIGVISHVSEMKDRFPERIFVQPQADGTSVVIHGS